MNSKVKFKGTIIKNVWDSSEFKVYAVAVDNSQYPHIEKNNFNNVSISGDMPDLTINAEYEITGIKTNSKHGVGYKVINIRRDLPKTSGDIYNFLSEILTKNQADVLFAEYPNIVDIVKDGKSDEVDLSKLKGIKEYTFKNIVKKIEENYILADLVVEFQGLLSLSIIKKIYDKYTSVEKVIEHLERDPYDALTQISGIGFKSADKIILDIEAASNQNIREGKNPILNFKKKLRDSPERCLACIIHLLKENESNGNTKMRLQDLRKQVISLVKTECANHFDTVIEYDEIWYDRETMWIALSSTKKTEAYIAKNILKLNANKSNKWKVDAEKYRNVSDDIKLTDEQIELINVVCNNNVCILTGSAGMGKSASVKALINALDDMKKTYLLATPTGKSSKVLKEFTNRESKTIHRLLGYTPSNTWMFNEENKLKADIVILDEFSMVDIWLFKKLLMAIDTDKTKLLLIGDYAQLCSIGAGNLLHDFIDSNSIATIQLSKIFRYQDGGLMKVATDTRMSKPYLSNDNKLKATQFGNNKDYMFVDLPSEKISTNVVALYKKLLDSGYSVEDIQVLSAKNVGSGGSIELNNLVQKVANKNYGSAVNLKVGDTVYYEGDIVMQKVNNYKANVYSEECFDEPKTAFIANGESGKIIKIKDKTVLIDFDDVIIEYNQSEMNMVQLGYSISIHKSQGSSIKIVILVTPKSHIFMLNSNLIYVGLTRTKEKCFHLGSMSAVNTAVTKKEDMKRDTFMKELLTGN